MVQQAICYREAGQYARAADMFQLQLAAGVFAPRDQAFYSAQLAETLALAHEPDQAATTALEALRMASKPRFGGTLEQLVRVWNRLRPYADRTQVRDLHQQLSALAA